MDLPVELEQLGFRYVRLDFAELNPPTRDDIVLEKVLGELVISPCPNKPRVRHTEILRPIADVDSAGHSSPLNALSSTDGRSASSSAAVSA